MADPSAEHWYPTAAYLYTLHLDGPALAWEYLRRHPDYRRDWLRRRRRPEAAARWGLRLLEDPALDARDAHPAGSLTTMLSCNSIPMPTRHPMRWPSRSGAFPARNAWSTMASAWCC